jgi:hypothetical protein
MMMGYEWSYIDLSCVFWPAASLLPLHGEEIHAQGAFGEQELPQRQDGSGFVARVLEAVHVEDPVAFGKLGCVVGRLSGTPRSRLLARQTAVHSASMPRERPGP